MRRFNWLTGCGLAIWSRRAAGGLRAREQRMLTSSPKTIGRRIPPPRGPSVDFLSAPELMGEAPSVAGHRLSSEPTAYMPISPRRGFPATARWCLNQTRPGPGEPPSVTAREGQDVGRSCSTGAGGAPRGAQQQHPTRQRETPGPSCRETPPSGREQGPVWAWTARSMNPEHPLLFLHVAPRRGGWNKGPLGGTWGGLASH